MMSIVTEYQQNLSAYLRGTEKTLNMFDWVPFICQWSGSFRVVMGTGEVITNTAIEIFHLINNSQDVKEQKKIEDYFNQPIHNIFHGLGNIFRGFLALGGALPLFIKAGRIGVNVISLITYDLVFRMERKLISLNEGTYFTNKYLPFQIVLVFKWMLPERKNDDNSGSEQQKKTEPLT